MTDKEFDSILKDALTSEEVPAELNRALLTKAKNRKKSGIITFIKSASAVAAVFICAVAVLSFYNSDMPRHNNDVAPAKESTAVTGQEKDEAPERKKETEAAAPVQSAKTAAEETKLPEKEHKTSPPENTLTSDGAPAQTQAAESGVSEASAYKADSVETADAGEAVASVPPAKRSSGGSSSAVSGSSTVSGGSAGGGGGGSTAKEKTAADTTDTAVATDAAEAAKAESSAEETFSMARKAVPAALSEIFQSGYDYKAVITGRISAQISALPNSGDYTFTGITGNEAFVLSDENTLTITFAAGEILPEEHGEQFFTVGTVVNGVLR